MPPIAFVVVAIAISLSASTKGTPVLSQYGRSPPPRAFIKGTRSFLTDPIVEVIPIGDHAGHYLDDFYNETPDIYSRGLESSGVSSLLSSAQSNDSTSARDSYEISMVHGDEPSGRGEANRLSVTPPSDSLLAHLGVDDSLYWIRLLKALGIIEQTSEPFRPQEASVGDAEYSTC
ncbi:hypothetical protein FRC17_007143 [Serendipita sp. 399]|nr:hypothetical protein FRC17_007143 [Serendipita sp. 399]